MNHISFTTKQAKAIKTLLLNQDSKNEVTKRILEGLKRVDNDMTLEEAHIIVDKMKPEKKNAVNKMLLGNIQVSSNTYYNMKKNANEICKSWWFILIMWILNIGVITLGVILASILSVSVY